MSTEGGAGASSASWTLANGRLTATVAAHGAELTSLRDATGQELLWQAGPAWPRHAPVLFPIVGRLKDDTLRHAGRAYRLGQHGFARDRRFDWLRQGATDCRLALTDDAETLAAYPFPFRFEVAYALDGPTLTVAFTIANPGPGMLPASCGAHPAFRWPLPGAPDKAGHRLEFEQAETAPVRRSDPNGLLAAERQALPVDGRVLSLHEDLFRDGALVLERPASGHVRFSAPGAPTIEVAWQGFRELGLWTKPGADFLCIEPWHGTADPVGFDGGFLDKPGLMLIPSGESRVLTHRITVE